MITEGLFCFLEYKHFSPTFIERTLLLRKATKAIFKGCVTCFAVRICASYGETRIMGIAAGCLIGGWRCRWCHWRRGCIDWSGTAVRTTWKVLISGSRVPDDGCSWSRCVLSRSISFNRRCSYLICCFFIFFVIIRKVEVFIFFNLFIRKQVRTFNTC